jgi:hypothetical protein
MPMDVHTKAAAHHETAAKSHKMAAEHHGKGDHAKGARNPPKPPPTRKPPTTKLKWRMARASPTNKRMPGEAIWRGLAGRVTAQAPSVREHPDGRRLQRAGAHRPGGSFRRAIAVGSSGASHDAAAPRGSYCVHRPFVLHRALRALRGWLDRRNLRADSLGFRPIDPPAFAWLQVVISL